MDSLRICKSCGGTIVRKGNYYVCEYCQNKWEIDVANDVHAVERANAWEALRQGEFDKASELFDDIILREGKNHEAYWGKALADNAILYVTDLNENKKVPTCNNITENSFIEDKNVKKAIALAPDGIKESYKAQAEYIERVRIEWLKIASREPSYDVFLSFKDSDKENGIERTQDSIDAQDLYNALVAEGYKVFFSRVSLRDKVSEKYEPYIYNAIKTAKVMIVFGEKPQYFSSVWIKNEWQRFKARIEKGEKHKNSLVVVYKNMSPSELPPVLKSRQCLNAADLTFFTDLNRHVKRVIDETKQSEHIERKEIKGGKISKKAAKIENENLETRELGRGAIETSISEKQQLNLVNTYIELGQWGDADKLLDDILFKSPECSEAIWQKFLVKYRISTLEGFKPKVKKSDFGESDFNGLEKTLNTVPKSNAEKLLELLYSVCIEESTSSITTLKILSVVLPFNCRDKQSKIEKCFDKSIRSSDYSSFKLLITTLESHEVDRYINYQMRFAQKTQDKNQRSDCIDAILSVDSGNEDALWMRFQECWKEGDFKKILSSFEEILSYSQFINEKVSLVLKYVSKNLSNEVHCKFAKQAVSYYTAALSYIEANILSIASIMISHKFFEFAKYFLELVFSFNSDNPEVYWKMCLVKLGAEDDLAIIRANESIKSIPEYTKYLTLVDTERRRYCIDIAARQEKRQADDADKKHRVEEYRLKLQNEERLKAEQERKKKRKKRIKIAIIISIILAPILLAASIYYLTTAPSIIFEYEDCDGGIAITEIPDRKNVEIPSEIRGKKVVKIKSSATNKNKTIQKIIIPDSVTYIEYYAFKGCTNLTSVTIGNGVTSIGASAFSGCSGLRNITIPNSVTSIGEGAFYECTYLASITIPDSVTSIGKSAFQGCKRLKSIIIPNRVTIIDAYAFSGCSSLTSITIPNSVTSIGNDAFYGCKSLTDIYYTGSEAQWSSISIERNNGELINATKHYNYTK